MKFTLSVIDENKQPKVIELESGHPDLRNMLINNVNMRRVALTEFGEDEYLSTVLLPWGGTEFETMLKLGGEWREEYTERYATYEEAFAGHNRILAIVRTDFDLEKWLTNE